MPEAHAEVRRQLVVPVLYGDQIMATKGLACIHPEQAADNSRIHEGMETILKACTRGGKPGQGFVGIPSPGSWRMCESST
jgi:hypothetical protein